MDNEILETLQNIEKLLIDIDGLFYIIVVIGAVFIVCSVIYKLLMRFA